jgi:uncharacterized protein YbjT (DUF2867 family)
MNVFGVSNKKENQILVVGATGDLGGAVMRTLLSKSKSVRVLVRPQSNYKPLIDMGAQAVIGDLKNRISLDPACKDIEILITTATSAKRGGDDNPKTVDLEGNRNLIDAAKVAGVKQFIFVSANIADSNSPNPLMQAKGATEDYLRSSGVPFTIIAPDAFMEIWVAMVVGMPALAGQPVTLVGTGNRKHSFISSFDVAKFIIASINNPAAINQKLVLGGLEPLSFREVVAIFERFLGRKIPVQSVSFGEPVPGFPDAMAQIIGGFDTYDSAIDMTNTSKTFAVKLTPLEEFAKSFVQTQSPERH